MIEMKQKDLALCLPANAFLKCNLYHDVLNELEHGAMYHYNS